MEISKSVKRLKAEWITPKNFQPYGQVIFATEDAKPYDEYDAQLQLQHGTLRFYIMRLRQRGRRFHTITRHVKCTQCLGSLSSKVWFIAVAPALAGSQLLIEAITVFQIPGDCFIKLNLGTWHAGPYFEDDFVDFYNLELSDTNINDHDTCNLLDSYNLEFEIV